MSSPRETFEVEVLRGIPLTLLNPNAGSLSARSFDSLAPVNVELTYTCRSNTSDKVTRSVSGSHATPPSSDESSMKNKLNNAVSEGEKEGERDFLVRFLACLPVFRCLSADSECLLR